MDDSDSRSESSSSSSSSNVSDIFYGENNSISMPMAYSARSFNAAKGSNISMSSDDDASDCAQSSPINFLNCSVKSASAGRRLSSSSSSDSDDDLLTKHLADHQSMAYSKRSPHAINRSSNSSLSDRDMIFDQCFSTVRKEHSVLSSFQHGQDDDDTTEEKEETWPTNDQDIVRYLINKQKFDGVWDLDGNIIEKLTGKPLTSFSSLNRNVQILISSIVLVSLETRFASHSTICIYVLNVFIPYICISRLTSSIIFSDTTLIILDVIESSSYTKRALNFILHTINRQDFRREFRKLISCSKRTISST
ncbi:unnamed protein product [Rotaria sp. Silwood1]|nr:unnamed protein product [Rotaria sp. Silwood1]CAF4990813.1 unnamed protein product [Rotaria sp. Silwood1]